MASLLLRKKPTITPSRRTLMTLASLIEGFYHQPSISTSVSSDLSGEVRGVLPFSGSFGGLRKFHTRYSEHLNFKATFASQAGFAVADYSDEEKSKPSTDAEGKLEISKLGIHQDIVSALAKKGITKLFPIQRAVLEPAMQGRDMIGRARTGTGKTLAFGIPIMDKIMRYNAEHGCGRNPLALVLAPTRELAKQVEREFYDSAPNLDTLCVYGGTPINQQMSSLDRGVDVIVGTPGRVIDLLKRGALDLSEVKFVVLDEADQMLNVGFEEAVEVILEKLPRKRQGLMFSATMPNWILKLTRKYLNDPLTIDLVGDSDQKLADGIKLFAALTEHNMRAAVVGPLVAEHAKGGKCIIFTQTKRDASGLAYAMGKRNYKCEPLHGDISQNQRERTLEGFRTGRFNILVATDVAARGLDVPNVDLVIHYELPNSSEIFVHRSGRTGRAGKKGTAILIYTADQARSVKVLERDVACRFEELSRIAVDGADREIIADMRAGGQFGSHGSGGMGRYGNAGGFGRSPSYGSNFGRSSSYGGSGLGRSGGTGSGFSRGGYGDFESYGSPSGRSAGGNSGFGRAGSGFGSFQNSERSSGFGNSSSGRSGGYGNAGTSQRSSNFGTPRASRYGGFGFDKE